MSHKPSSATHKMPAGFLEAGNAPLKFFPCQGTTSEFNPTTGLL